MVFFYFGPSADSWAFGNDNFSMAQNLPHDLQEVWNNLAQVTGDLTMVGSMVAWLSTSQNGDYALMTKFGEFLSNNNEVLVAAQSRSEVDHVSFTPPGGWFMHFRDGSVQLSPPATFPNTFHKLAGGFLNTTSTRRQRSEIKFAIFGAHDVVILGGNRGTLAEGPPGPLAKRLAPLIGQGPRSPGLGRNTNLCQQDDRFYFLEIDFPGGAPRYEYNFASQELTGDLMVAVAANERPAPHLIPWNSGNAQSITAGSQEPPHSHSRYQRQFQENSGGKGYMTGMEATMAFMESGLSRTELASIWNRAQLDQEGRISQEKFIHVMVMIDQQKTRGPSHMPPQHAQNQDFAPPPGPPPPSTQGGSDFAPPPGPPQSHSPNPSMSGGGMCGGLDPTNDVAQRVPPRSMPLKEPWFCHGCKMGAMPGDLFLHCEQDGNKLCQKCQNRGGCPHPKQPVRIEPPVNVGNKSQQGMAAQCRKCMMIIKKDDLMWSCPGGGLDMDGGGDGDSWGLGGGSGGDSLGLGSDAMGMGDMCDGTDLCVDCWRKGDICKHTEEGKTTLYKAKKGMKPSTAIKVAHAIGSVMGAG